MARIVPASEVGLGDIGRVRVSSSKARRGKILAVEHPIFGWVKYREWAFLNQFGKLVEQIGPLELTAWVGFTLGYKGTIDSLQGLADWIQSAAGGPAGAVADFATWWARGMLNLFIPRTDVGGGGGSNGLIDWEGPGGDISGIIGGGIGGFFESIGKSFFPFGEISEWFWAAIAGAISVLALRKL